MGTYVYASVGPVGDVEHLEGGQLVGRLPLVHHARHGQRLGG